MVHLVNKQKKHFIVHLFKTILQFEQRWMLRSGIFFLLLGIYLLTGGFALYYGHGVATERQLVIDSIQKDYHHRFDSLVTAFRTADTSTVAGKTTVYTLAEPAVVQYRLKAEAILSPTAFSLLSVGISDMAGYRHTADINWSYAGGEEKLANPLKLLTGNFDLSFLLIYIIPLIVIGLNYNLLYAEKEQGTLMLLHVQRGNIHSMVIQRLLLRWGLLLALFILLTLAGLGLSGANQVTPFSLGYWFIIAAAYIGIWTGISFSIISLNRTSAFNAVSLLSIWILLVIAIPAACTVSHTAPNSSTTRMAAVAAEQRETEWAVWELSKKQLLDSFYVAYPEYKDAHAYDTSPGSGRRGMAYYHLLQQRMDRFIKKEERLQHQQAQTLSSTYLFNPVVYTQSLCNEIAGTDVSDYAFFQQQVKHFHQQWKQFFYAYAFRNRKFTPAEYYTLPRFVMTGEPAKINRIGNGILYLLGICLCCWLAGWWRIKKFFLH
jgi:ABC-2 type transport system permease protein